MLYMDLRTMKQGTGQLIAAWWLWLLCSCISIA